jgi:hypothetical protein
MAQHDDSAPDTAGQGGLPLARPGVKWRDLPGTTLALTSLAILGAAAIVSTPFWVLYRRKMKRVDKMINEGAATATLLPDADETTADGTASPADTEAERTGEPGAPGSDS